MTEEWELADLAKEVPVLVSAHDLPDEFVAVVIDAQIKEDRQGRKGLYLRIQLEDGKQTVIKYTPMHIAELVKHLAKLRIKTKSELVGKKFKFKRTQFRIGFPRPIPVEVVKQ